MKTYRRRGTAVWSASVLTKVCATGVRETPFLAASAVRVPRVVIEQSWVQGTATCGTAAPRCAESLALHRRAPKGALGGAVTRGPHLRSTPFAIPRETHGDRTVTVQDHGRKHRKHSRRQQKTRRQKRPPKCGFKNMLKCVANIERKIGDY